MWQQCQSSTSSIRDGSSSSSSSSSSNTGSTGSSSSSSSSSNDGARSGSSRISLGIGSQDFLKNENNDRVSQGSNFDWQSPPEKRKEDTHCRKVVMVVMKNHGNADSADTVRRCDDSDENGK